MSEEKKEPLRCRNCGQPITEEEYLYNDGLCDRSMCLVQNKKRGRSIDHFVNPVTNSQKRKSKAVILDRDGTLNVDEKEYTYRVEDFELYDGVIEGLKELRNFKLFIVTNQPGIGRRYYTEEDMHRFNERMLKEFLKYGIKIERIYFCPHAPEESCNCRKPSTRFIKEAEKDFDLDLSRSWVIGDHGFDVEMGINAGCRTIYLLTGHGKRHLSKLTVKPDYIAGTFLEGAVYITKDEKD